MGDFSGRQYASWLLIIASTKNDLGLFHFLTSTGFRGKKREKEEKEDSFLTALYAAAALRSDYKPTREAKGANHPVAYSSALVLAKNDVM